ncbi:MAG: carbamoyl-phosphate synthase large subunit [Halobacteria archaeon]
MKDESLKKVLVIGSGPIIIGQAAEFDYSGSQACRSLREEGVEVALVNSNPATIMTDEEIADRIYIEPLTPEVVARILRRERPNGLLPSVGGQTGLNLTVQLKKMGVLEETGVRVIGSPVESIEKAEDRDLFFRFMKDLGEPIPGTAKCATVEEALRAADPLGYPVMVRPGFCLGGTGTGIAYNREELRNIAARGIAMSLNREINLDQCVLGWKELEYEVMRDSADNCITVCNMENFDPMGVHTGDSIVVAPAQTLTDREHQVLRSAALRVIRGLKIEGGCNIQFAVRPDSFEYRVIEVNPRVSRSSALASKATGYPIARVAAKIALGMTLDEIPNRVTGTTPACFEPALDYVVVKIPRWPFDKFRTADRTLGTQMKSTGEVMAIGRTFEEALQKAVRSLDIGRRGLGLDGKHTPATEPARLRALLRRPSDRRLFYVRDALAAGMSIEEISKLSAIDPWFLAKIRNLVELERELRENRPPSARARRLLRRAKESGFSDAHIAALWSTTEARVRALRKSAGLLPGYKMVDTCAAEFEARTPYYYSTYRGSSDAPVSRPKARRVVILGSGPIRIGQGIEFDYSTVHAVAALREMGAEAVIINNNPETVSTDFDISDRLYFEPLTFEDVMNVVERERPEGVMVQFGGQTAINLVEPLRRAGVKILGTPPEMVDAASDRGKFRALAKRLGIHQADAGTARSFARARAVAKRIGYPVLVRPSYVLGGRAMETVQDEEELEAYMEEAIRVSEEHPILIDRFLQGATEIDVDAAADGKEVFVGGIMEHIEEAGIHSGDSACVVPPQTLPPPVQEEVLRITRKLARALKIKGLMNLQAAVLDGKVYILEVNPRASRTVPFISKATGVALAKVAARAALGVPLRKQGLPPSPPPVSHVAVKEVVFPFVKLPGVDPVLGPEMKSTGEVMGMDRDFGTAFYKAELEAGNELPKSGNLLVTVRREDQKATAPLARRLRALGFKLYATEGTARALEREGLDVHTVLKISEGRPNALDLLKNRSIHLVVHTLSRGRQAKRDGFLLRRHCVEFSVPYLTTLAALRASVEALERMKSADLQVLSVQEYRRAS